MQNNNTPDRLLAQLDERLKGLPSNEQLKQIAQKLDERIGYGNEEIARLEAAKRKVNSLIGNNGQKP